MRTRLSRVSQVPSFAAHRAYVQNPQRILRQTKSNPIVLSFQCSRGPRSLETVPKTLTREQLESRKEKAERFVRDVLGDTERADEIADESLEDYADRRKIQLADNPPGGHMTVRASNSHRVTNGSSRVAN